MPMHPDDAPTDTEFRPDYTEAHTARAFKRHFGQEFEGPGLYTKEGDTMIIAPRGVHTNIWAKTGWDERQVFLVHVYNKRSPFAMLGMLGSAPTRFDDRA